MDIQLKPGGVRGWRILSQLEWPTVAAPSLRTVFADFGMVYAASGFIGFLFAATGPVAIILSVAGRAGLTPAELASWIFGVFFVNGAITVGMSWRYRQPLCFFWTIPGTVLVGQALQHLSYPAAIASFYATGLLVLGIGLSGWFKRAMTLVPMPVVMGMVAGVFLRFGLDLVRAVRGDLAIAGPMVVVFLLLSATQFGRRMPPLIGALLAGALAAVLLSRIDPAALGALEFARPVGHMPIWSPQALGELVVPLAVTVLVVQNGQGFALLTAVGHAPPVNMCTAVCGIGSLFSATVGAVNTCITGPTNALVTSSGEPARHYTAAVATGVLAIVFGLLSPTFTGLMLAAPEALITALGGLAMLRVLQGAFIGSFAGRFTMGALVSFLVTIADVPILNVGGAFWGLLSGLAVSFLLERGDFPERQPPGL